MHARQHEVVWTGTSTCPVRVGCLRRRHTHAPVRCRTAMLRSTSVSDTVLSRLAAARLLMSGHSASDTTLARAWWRAAPQAGGRCGARTACHAAARCHEPPALTSPCGWQPATAGSLPATRPSAYQPAARAAAGCVHGQPLLLAASCQLAAATVVLAQRCAPAQRTHTAMLLPHCSRLMLPSASPTPSSTRCARLLLLASPLCPAVQAAKLSAALLVAAAMVPACRPLPASSSRRCGQ